MGVLGNGGQWAMGKLRHSEQREPWGGGEMGWWAVGAVGRWGNRGTGGGPEGVLLQLLSPPPLFLPQVDPCVANTTTPTPTSSSGGPVQ